MIYPFKIFCLIGFVLSLTGEGRAQVITDSESSANYLAAQIATSSGLPAANYENYANSLAKTLAKLSPAQQAIVFGLGGNGSSLPNGGFNPPATDGDSPPASTGNPLADIIANEDNSTDGGTDNSSTDGGNGSTDGSGTDTSSDTVGNGTTDTNDSSDDSGDGFWDSFFDFLDDLWNAAVDFFTS